MNNLRLLAGLLAATLLSGGVCAVGQTKRVVSIEDLFDIAEANSVQLRPTLSAEEEARRDISVARSEWLPDIEATLSLSYIGDGFTTDRGFKDYQRADIPHLGDGLALNITQPVYTGGAISSGIGLAKKGTEMAENSRTMSINSVRMALATNYLELAKHRNLLQVYNENIRLTEKLIGEMKAKHAQGVVLKNDITRYELRLSSLTYDRLATENAIRIFNNNLVSMLGLDQSTEIIPDIATDGNLNADGDARHVDGISRDKLAVAEISRPVSRHGAPQAPNHPR